MRRRPDVAKVGKKTVYFDGGEPTDHRRCRCLDLFGGGGGIRRRRSRAKRQMRQKATILYRWLWVSKRNRTDDLNGEDIETRTKHLKEKFLYIINRENGFIEELVNAGLLAGRQDSQQEPPNYDEQIRLMAEDALTQSVPDEATRTFLSVLDKTLQKHASNYARGKGIYEPTYGNNWPLIEFKSELINLEKNIHKFRKCVDSRHGLLNKMFEASCLTEVQKRILEACPSDNKMNEALYYLVRRGSREGYRAFIQCLIDTEQHHIASLLASSFSRNIRPINEWQEFLLQKHHSKLIDDIDTISLLAQLFATRCITLRQRQYIEDGEAKAEKNDRLLDIVARGSEENYNKFIECLNKTNQGHLGNLLAKDPLDIDESHGWKTEKPNITSCLYRVWFRAKKRESSSTSTGVVVKGTKKDIDKLENKLLYMINTENGLLDVLVSEGLLTGQQKEVIQKLPSYYEQISLMLNGVLSGVDYENVMSSFFMVLDHTLHEHVSNYIRCKAKREDAFGAYWPLIDCEPDFTVLERNSPQFRELVDSRHGLLDEMFASFSLTRPQKQDLETQPVNGKRNEVLYYLIRRSSFPAYMTLIKCLVKTNQHHVAFMLKPDLDEYKRPVNEQHKSRLLKNHDVLIVLINTRNSFLLEKLSSNSCITWRQRDHIRSAETSVDNNRRLLVIMERGSEENFQRFVEILNEEDQRHIGRILSEDGVVVQLSATNTGKGDLKKIEKRISDRMMATLRDGSVNPEDSFSVKLQQHTIVQQDKDAPLLATKEGLSIGFFYFCKSLRGWEYLCEEFSSKRLRTILEELIVLAGSETTSRDSDDVVKGVDDLRWDQSNYINCAATFVDIGYIQTAHRLAHQSLRDPYTVHSDTPINIAGFPVELREMILLKAAGCLFAVIDAITPRANMYTMVVLSIVSDSWWKCLTKRDFIKRQIKRYFKQVSYPFRCNPRKLGSHPVVGGNNDVAGITELEGRLYVVCEKSNVVHVYANHRPFVPYRTIALHELKDPRDIVACSETRQLFIADVDTPCAIRRVQLVNNVVAGKLKSITIEYPPLSMSVKAGRLLITARQGDSLFRYANYEEGTPPEHTPVPPNMLVSHAVESSRNTYIVSHYNQRAVAKTQFELNSITELNVKGQIVRLFNSQPTGTRSIQFHRPQYLVLHDDHVIIADTRSGRIILSTSDPKFDDLQFKRVLIHSSENQPHRVCFSQSSILFVSYIKSREIDVFRVT